MKVLEEDYKEMFLYSHVGFGVFFVCTSKIILMTVCKNMALYKEKARGKF